MLKGLFCWKGLRVTFPPAAADFILSERLLPNSHWLPSSPSSNLHNDWYRGCKPNFSASRRNWFSWEFAPASIFTVSSAVSTSCDFVSLFVSTPSAIFNAGTAHLATFPWMVRNLASWFLAFLLNPFWTSTFTSTLWQFTFCGLGYFSRICFTFFGSRFSLQISLIVFARLGTVGGPPSSANRLR